MTSIRKALGISFIERYALIVLSLVSYVLIARLLTPQEIGIYSVTAALVGIAQVIREFGIGSYLIQAKELRQSHIDTAFSVAMLAGFSMFGVGFVAAPWVADFYADQRLQPILRVMAINFVVLPVCSITLSLLRRSMKFEYLLWVNLNGAIVGFVATIALAATNHGASSLAWGAVTCNLMTAAVGWNLISKELRPRRLSVDEWRGLLAFGRLSTFAGVITSAAIDINDIVVGRLLGFAPVAILSRAMGLMNLFQRDLMGAAKNVAYPAFAAMHRNGQEIEPAFVYSVSAVTAASWTFFGFLALFPLECLRLMAGDQWDAAVPLVRYFAAAGACVSVSTLVQPLMLAVGRIDLASAADIVVHALRLVMVVVTAFLYRDLEMVALAVAASYVIASPILFIFKQFCIPNNWGGLVSQVWRSAAVAGLSLFFPCLLSVYASLGRNEPVSTPIFLAVCIVVCLSWLVSLSRCRHPVSKEEMYLAIMSRLRLTPKTLK